MKHFEHEMQLPPEHTVTLVKLSGDRWQVLIEQLDTDSFGRPVDNPQIRRLTYKSKMQAAKVALMEALDLGVTEIEEME